MLKALLLAIIAVLAAIVAARLLYAVVLLAILLISALFNGVLIPVLRGVFWLVVQTISLPFRVLAAIFRPLRLAPASSVVLGAACVNTACRCANPAEARYCRRCGAAVAAF